jgi:V-type H+-transporting ATPase subunit H
LIRAFNKNSSNPQEYAELFLNLLSKLSRVDTIQSILVLIDDFLQEQESACAAFTNRIDRNSTFTPFIKLLTKEDEYIPLKAAKIVTYLLV